jgi:hypothetical protein
MRDKDISSDKKIEKFLKCEFEEFKKVLQASDHLNILKFHLLFENILERIIVKVLKRGDRLIDKGNLSFAQKLMIVHSFDIISDSYIQALRHLNSLSNELSHDKMAIITLDNFDLVGRPLGRAYTNIKNKYKNDHLFKVTSDTFFLIHKGLVRKIAEIEFGNDEFENYFKKKKSTGRKLAGRSIKKITSAARNRLERTPLHEL